MRKDLCEYKFSLDDQFFTDIDAPEVHKGKVEVNLVVKKNFGAFTLDFSIEGNVVVICDRCLDEMTIPVEAEETLKVKLGEEYEEDDDLIIIPESEGIINVAWNIYEFIVLHLPMIHVHPDGECNEEMMKTLSDHLSYQVDEEDDDDSECENEADDEEPTDTGKIDPRWNELKKILNNN